MVCTSEQSQRCRRLSLPASPQTLPAQSAQRAEANAKFGKCAPEPQSNTSTQIEGAALFYEPTSMGTYPSLHTCPHVFEACRFRQ
mmetsp:Transcript_142817/g.266242  ORF Transcript_142817/g.266242 Transcript_142817/m.266242 type:complete len:85 (+) Transcript_142817:142-396(+)